MAHISELVKLSFCFTFFWLGKEPAKVSYATMGSEEYIGEKLQENLYYMSTYDWQLFIMKLYALEVTKTTVLKN